MAGTLEHIDACLKAARAQARQLTRQVRDTSRRRDRARSRTLHICSVAFAHDAEGLPRYLEYVRRVFPGLFEETEEVLATRIGDMYLATTPDEIARWLNWQCSHLLKSEIDTAKRLVEEARVLRWVEAQNADKGVAPPGRFVWNEFKQIRAECTTEAVDQRPHTDWAAKKWLWRFRRRWQVEFGTQPVEEILPVASMQNKVSEEPKTVPKKDRIRDRTGFKRGAAIWTHFRGRSTILNQKTGPLYGTFLGTVFGPRRWRSGNGCSFFIPVYHNTSSHS